MYAHRQSIALITIVLLLLAGCQSTAAPPTASPSPTAAPAAALPSPTPTSVPPAPMPVPPTATAAPPTAVPSPTPTDIPPSATPVPTSTPELAQPSVDDVLSSLEGLPIDEFLTESWRRLQARDADILFSNRFADIYGVAPGDQFTDLSADYIQETQRLERGVQELLRAYDRGALSTGQRVSYDSLDWYLAIHVRGQEFSDYRFLVNPVWGLQNWPIDFLIEYPIQEFHTRILGHGPIPLGILGQIVDEWIESKSNG